MRERFLSLGKYAGAIVTVGGILLLLRFFLSTVLAVSLPFLVAWGLALLADPLSKRIAEKAGLSRRALRVCLALSAFSLIGGGGFFVFRQAWRELGGLLTYLSENPDRVNAITERVRAWLSHLPLAEGAPSPLSILSDALSGIVSALSRLLGVLLLRLPSLLLLLFVTVIASVYFALDLEKINAALLRCIPAEYRDGAARLRRALRRGCRVYLRSYALLFCLTLTVSLVGFLLLGVRYALLLALIVAVVDLLPVLGVGCALCPWAAVCLLLGETGRAVGLLLLWLVATVLRQIAEPRLVGGRLGLHPLLALFSMYAGLRVFGFFGMLSAPLLLSVLTPLFSGEGDAEA